MMVILKGGGNIQSLFEKKIFFFGNTPPGGKKNAKNRLRASPKIENASLTLIQGKYRFFRPFLN
jgi:hypothetical protein